MHESVESMMARRAANGYGIKVAVKRYGKLEALYDALAQWMQEGGDTDENWRALCAAFDACDEYPESK